MTPEVLAGFREIRAETVLRDASAASLPRVTKTQWSHWIAPRKPHVVGACRLLDAEARLARTASRELARENLVQLGIVGSVQGVSIMKKYGSLSGAVLSLLAASVTGCGDEKASTPEDIKSSITAQSFVVDGCNGVGAFNIASNNLINFVGLDQSSFANMSASLYAVDQNNVQTLIASNEHMSAVSENLASLFQQATNYTSAYQLANQIATQLAEQASNAYATNSMTQNNVATTSNSTYHSRVGSTRAITSNNASGYNNAWNSSDANTLASNSNQMNAWDAANSGAATSAANGASNASNSALASGNRANGYNSSGMGANQGAFNSASRVGTTGGAIAAAPVGWGVGGWGWGPIANIASFNSSAVFGSQYANSNAYTAAGANNAAYASAADNAFSSLFSDTRASSYNNVNSGNSGMSQSHVSANDRTSTGYSTGNVVEQATAVNEQLATYDSATTANSLASNGATAASNGANSRAMQSSSTSANEAAGASSGTSSTSSAMNQQFTAASNLSQYNANNLVLKLNVTANTESAIVRVFTGNNASNLAANQDFAYAFPGCGVAAGPYVGPVVAPVAGPYVAPVPVVAPVTIKPLGDRVAKPE